MFPRKQVEVEEGRLGIPAGLQIGNNVQVTRVRHAGGLFLAMRRGMGPWHRVDMFSLMARGGSVLRLSCQVERTVQLLIMLGSRLTDDMPRGKNGDVFPREAHFQLVSVQNIDGHPFDDMFSYLAKPDGTLKEPHRVRAGDQGQYDWVLHLKIVPRED